LFFLSENNYFWRGWIISLAALGIAGILYRGAAAQQEAIENQISSISIPLKSFPTKVNKWSGENIETDYPIEKATGCNDYLFRLYKNNETRQWANVYVTFCSQPRKMLGHRPEVCFTASGWEITDHKKSYFTTTYGKKVPCVKYLFEKPVWPRDEMTVLNFYLINGKLTDNHKDFSSLRWRRLTDPDEQIRYVTQVQISSSNENAAMQAAKEMTDLIVNFFPREINSN